MERMISVNEKLPEYEKLVLIYYITTRNEKRYGIAYRYYDAQTKKSVWILGTNAGFALSNVTHWQYLPDVVE